MPLTVAQLVARLTADTSGFYRSMAIANASMLRTGGLVTRAAAGIGLAVTGIGLVSLRAAGNFQQSMNILQAVSGATAGQMNLLDKEAIALGADFKLPNVSAKDAADAMQELAKGGLSVNQILGATRGTLQLGLAANIGFADSATIVARALSAFSLSGKSATTVADLFTATANKSTADMTDVALGFQMASAQFAGTGHTIDELTTSLGLMANAGVVGSDAGTSLKTMINRLTAPTQKASDLMKDLGIQVYDSSGNMKSMPDIITELNDAMDGMSQKQKNAALYTIFGSDAIRAARIQMKAGTKGWMAFHDQITKGGEAQKFAEARTKGFNGALQAFGSAAETLAIQLGTALLPAATSVVRAMSRFVAAIDPNKVIGFFSAISGGVKFIYNLITGVPILTALVAGLTAAFITHAAITKVVATATRIYAAAMILLDAAMAANPIILIIAALVGLGIALVVLWKRSETFRNIVIGTWEALKAAVLTTVNFIRYHWQLLIAILLGPIGIAVALVTKYWSQIKSATVRIFTSVLNFLKEWGPLLLIVMTLGMALVVATIIRHWRRIWNITVSIFNAVKDFISGVVSAIVGVVKSVLSPVVGVVKTIWNNVKSAVSTVLDAIKGVVSDKINGIIDVLRGIIGLAAGYGMQIGQAIVSGIVAGLWNIVSSVGGAIADGLNAAKDWAKGAIGAGSPSKVFRDEVGLPIVQGVAEGIRRGAAQIPRSLSAEMRHTLDIARAGLPSSPVSVPALVSPTSAVTAGDRYYTINIGGVVDEGNMYRLMRRAIEEHEARS